jgi:hypothetical protein
LSLLDDVVETIQAFAGIDRAAIEKEIAATKRDIERLPRDQRYDSRAAIKQQYIASQRARLEACTEQEVKVEKLLAQATACLAAVERVHLEVPALDGDQRERTTEQAAERLLHTVERARLARKRLSGSDDEATHAEDEAYERRGTEHI